MKKIELYLFSLFIIIFLDNTAKAEFIRGRVINLNTKEALENVKIYNAETKEWTTSNILGQFSIGISKNIHLKLLFIAIGFQKKEIDLDLSINSNPYLEIAMDEIHLDLPQVEVHANKQNYQEVISSFDLKTHPINSSQDILKIIPGLYLAQHAGGGKAEQLFLRGFDVDHGTDVAINVDGLPVNMVSHAHGQGYADLHFVIPELVNKVNYFKGPYEIHDGNFATAASVNFSTAHTLKNNFIKTEIGQFDKFRVVSGMNLALNQHKHDSLQNHQHAYIAGEFTYSNGYFDLPQHLSRYNLFAKHNVTINDNTYIESSLSYFNSQWNASGQIPDRAVKTGSISRFGSISDQEGGSTTRFNCNLKMFNKLNEKADWKHQIYYINYKFDLFSDFTFYLNDPINGDLIRQTESRNILGYNSNFSYALRIFDSPAKIESAIGVRSDIIPISKLDHMKNRNSFIQSVKNGKTIESNLFTFFNIKLFTNKKINVDPGLRLDFIHFSFNDLLSNQHNQKSKYILNPKLKINYNIDNYCELFLKLGSGYHSNDTRVSTLDSTSNILPQAKGIDIGVHYKPIQNLITGITLWILDTEDELVYVGDEGVVEINGSSQRIGLEQQLRFQLYKKWVFDQEINLTKARSKDEKSGENYIPLAPSLIGSIGLSYNKEEAGLFGYFRYRFISDRPANENNSIVAKGSDLCDFEIGFRKKKWELALTIQNVFNLTWEEAQFATESKLKDEVQSVEEIHFTSGTPFNTNLSFLFNF